MTPSSGPEPVTPTASQVEADAHTMPAKECTPAGTVCVVQVVPPSELLMITAVAEG